MAERPDRSQVVKTFGKEAADFLELAASLGWKVLFNSSGTSITLIPYDDGPKRIHLSSRNKGRGALRKHIKILTKHADPAYADLIVQLSESDDLPQDAQSQLVRTIGKAILDTDKVTVMEDPPKRERFVKPTAPVPTPDQVAKQVQKTRHIVSERPALMHYSITQQGGKSYPSRTTTERRWSDGVVDYTCAVSTCGEVSENRRAFGGAHWAMHVREGEAEAYDADEMKRSVVDDPSYTEKAWTRKASLRAKRTEELTNLLKGINLKEVTPEDLAAMLVEFLGDAGSGGTRNEPLTDADILDRIRTLVDRGTYAEQEDQIVALSKQHEDLVSYAAEREQEQADQIADANQRAARAEATLDAFRSLMAEIMPDKEET